MSAKHKPRCPVCNVPISPVQRRNHERSAWHQNYHLVVKALEAEMSHSEIARLIGSHPSAVSTYLKLSKNGA
jgi:hypothetical protein